MYNPDKWVLIRVDNTYFKVLGSWSGSYLYCYCGMVSKALLLH